jgi:hypothetical protein
VEPVGVTKYTKGEFLQQHRLPSPNVRFNRNSSSGILNETYGRTGKRINNPFPIGVLPEIRTSSIDLAQLNSFHLKTETESSLRNLLCLNRDRTTSNVQKHSNCINIPSSKTYSWNMNRWLQLLLLLLLVLLRLLLLSLLLYSPLLDLGRFSVSWSYIQSVGLLGRGISPSQSLYLHTEQHEHRINAHRHPCLEWDWNPRCQLSSERRQFMH